MRLVKSTPLDVRFWSRVRITSGCWVWIGSLDRLGYARIKVGGKRQAVHRVAYERLVGPIPEGLTLDHLCHVRACVRPDHLEPVTLSENTRRGNQRRWHP